MFITDISNNGSMNFYQLNTRSSIIQIVFSGIYREGCIFRRGVESREGVKCPNRRYRVPGRCVETRKEVEKPRRRFRNLGGEVESKKEV